MKQQTSYYTLLIVLIILCLQITACENTSKKNEAISKTENTSQNTQDIASTNVSEEVLIVKEIASDAQIRTLSFPISKSKRLQTWAIERGQAYQVKERLLGMNEQLKSISLSEEKDECTAVFFKEVSEDDLTQFFKLLFINNYKIVAKK